MRRFPSRFLEWTLAAACVSVPSGARAQACCAGASVVTPARLELHERALVGAGLKVAGVVGSYSDGGRYVPSPAADREVDSEEQVFGAVRVLRRGQVAVLLPIDETYRDESAGRGFGGGIGDVNATARYDLVLAGESRLVPGVAILAGVTAPTGRPPESATPPLNVDATGIGAWQLNAAVALEQTAGPWLVNATAIVAERTPRFGQTLAPQFTVLGAVAYAFDGGLALALSASYAFEGEATRAGAPVPGSAKRLASFAASGLWPVAGAWRLLGSVSVDPPLTGFGANQPALVGGTATVIYGWM